MQIWKIIDIIQESTAFLKTKGIENPRLNAEQLLGHLLQLSRVDLYVQFDRPLNKKEREDYKVLLKRRAQREPLQYILGSTEFMSLSFKVTPDVLIPRPETEILVEKTIELIGNSSYNILDIGTGSGCIAISLAHYCPNSQITAWDKSEKAIEIARENGDLNRVNDLINWQIMDIMQLDNDNIENKYDLIVSNPPYIAKNEWFNLEPELKDHEPQMALSDNEDGLTFYRIISKKAKELLTKNGKLIFEVGDTQSKPVTKIMNSEGFMILVTLHDLNNILRVVMGQLT